MGFYPDSWSLRNPIPVCLHSVAYQSLEYAVAMQSLWDSGVLCGKRECCRAQEVTTLRRLDPAKGL